MTIHKSPRDHNDLLQEARQLVLQRAPLFILLPLLHHGPRGRGWAQFPPVPPAVVTLNEASTQKSPAIAPSKDDFWQSRSLFCHSLVTNLSPAAWHPGWSRRNESIKGRTGELIPPISKGASVSVV